MDKKNYRKSLEKERQEISADHNEKLSRRTHKNTVKKKPKERKNLLLPILFFIFILIPVSILIYVAFLYEPDDTLTSTINEQEVSVENGSPKDETPVVSETDESEEEPEEIEIAQEDEQKNASEEKSEQPEEPQTPSEPAEQSDTSVKEEPKEQPEEQEQPSEPSQKTVTVKDGETLYRIAVNNYGAAGAAAAVEKIKQANGLTSNSIQPGQELVLP